MNLISQVKPFKNSHVPDAISIQFVLFPHGQSIMQKLREDDTVITKSQHANEIEWMEQNKNNINILETKEIPRKEDIIH
jgi:hypothetical protein